MIWKEIKKQAVAIRRSGSVWLKLNYSNRTASFEQFSAIGKTKQNT